MKTNALAPSFFPTLVIMLFLSFGPIGLGAQSADRFYPGTIVLRDGTERPGTIYYDQWVQTPGSIEFKGPEDASPRTYAPEDLTGFAVADLRYRSDTVTLSPDIADLSAEKPRMRFLREEVLGDVDLYSHVAGKDKLHLFVDIGTGPVELVYRKYRSGKRGYEYRIVTDEKFRGQLKYVLRACPEVARRADDISFTRQAVVDLVQDYHACIAAPVTVRYERSRADRRLKFMPLVGLAHTRLTYRTDRPRLRGADFPGSTTVTGGIGLEIEIAPRLQSLAVYTELIYQGADFQDDFPVRALGMNVVVTQLARYRQLRHNLGLRANVLPRSDLLFLSLGVSNFFYTRLEAVEEVTAPIVTDGVPFTTRTTGVGFHADLGARLGQFRLLLRYVSDNGFSLDPTVSTPLRHYRFLVGYSL